MTPSTSQTAPGSGSPPPGDDPITQLVAAYIKKNWDSHYRGAWKKLGSPTGLSEGTSWNWPAALVPVFWLAYRRESLLAAGWLFASLALRRFAGIGLVVGLVSNILLGLYGDRIILKHAWEAADQALRQHGPGEQATNEVSAAGGVSNRVVGWVLVLVVIVIIGIFAAIANSK